MYDSRNNELFLFYIQVYVACQERNIQDKMNWFKEKSKLVMIQVPKKLHSNWYNS